MNEQDLRDCFAMFAMVGLVMRGSPLEQISETSWMMADEMLEARKGSGSVGLPPVRARKAKTK